MDSLRIALFTDTFDETNGVAHTYRTLADHCLETGRTLDVFAPGCEDSDEARGSVRIHRFGRSLGLEYYDDLHFSIVPNRRVAHVFEDSGPFDLVQIAAPGNLGAWGRRLAKRWKLPLVGVHHTMLQDYAAIRAPWFLSELVRQGSLEILRRFYRPCHTVLAPTPGIADFVKQSGIGRRSDVFSRGVDSKRFSPDWRRRSDRKARLLYVGRLAVEKNLQSLARILSQVRSSVDCEMVFVGEGPLEGELRQALPWAQFEGRLKGDDLSQAYADGDIFVFPSLTDTFGNVVNEAQASGVPCIVMDRNGPGEIITPGRTGLLAPTESTFRESILRLVTDEGVRKSMGQAAADSARERSWDRVFARLWSVYGQVVRRPA